MDSSLVFIHGFLGHPEDWRPVAHKLGPHVASFHFLDLNKDVPESELNFQAWPQAFQRWLKDQKIESPITFVGYSMGGRLVLPLVERGWASSSILLSSQFGLPENAYQERAERRLQNQAWAEQWATGDWNEVLSAWNLQDVFKNSKNFLFRDEASYDRQKLAAMMTGFSLSEQKDYHRLLENKNLSWLYLAGQNDEKYGAIAESLRPYGEHCKARIIKESGHRLLLDQPQLVAQEISKFLSH